MDHRTVTITEVIGLLPYASNTTLLARIDDGTHVVYKPDDGERPLWDFEYGTLGSREVLTYEVAAAMGGGSLVPETWVADGPVGRGSAQRFLKEDFDFDAATLVRPEMHPWTWPVALLDVVTNNADRKFGHLIRDLDTGSFWAIDNGLTFHPEDKLRTVLWGYAGKPIPPEVSVCLQRLAGAFDDWLAARVADLLGTDEARALGARIDGLVADPRHPSPPIDRPAIPWPVY